MTALVVEDLTAGYGNVAAVRELSFSCGPGEVLSILGPNGAGKTTTLLAACGVIRPMHGSVVLFGEEMSGRPAHVVARCGLILLADDRGLFSTLTVAENLQLAERSAPAHRKGVEPLSRAQVLERFPQITGLLARTCGLLSGGEQQMVAIAKALLLGPRVLMVDELSLGLAPIIVQRLVPMLADLARSTGMALVLVEQHYELALAASDLAVVVNHGRVVLRERAADLLHQPTALEAAYFATA